MTLPGPWTEREGAGYASATTNSRPRKPGGLKLRYSTVPACPGNDLRLGRSDDTMCPAAIAACLQTEGPSYLVWTFVYHPAVPRTTAAFWELTGQRCVSAREPLDPEPREVPALSLEEFRRLPLPPGGLNVQPNTGEVLVNMKTNVYVTAKPVRLRTDVLGVPVDVLATPESYTWDFGDGEKLTTKDAGAPYPAMTTTHVYGRPGRYTIRLTVSYRGQFRPRGMQDWIPVEGTAPVGSAPITLEAIEARAVLVP